jgi:hypothetical protein
MSISSTKARITGRSEQPANRDALLDLLAPDRMPRQLPSTRAARKASAHLRLDKELLNLLSVH